MSVNYHLLPISDSDLSAILEVPEQIRDFVESHASEICDLGTDGLAILSLTATGDDDPLSFINSGVPPKYTEKYSGWIGEYIEKEGSVVTCEVDLGYGPASYYRNDFLRIVAPLLQPFDADSVGTEEHMQWLEENGVYPSGWLDHGRDTFLKRAFESYKSCVLMAAKSGLNLLVWRA